MSAAIDKALMELSLYEEDVPFDIPDRPEYSSCERNVNSIIGRILIRDLQKMSNLILDMPRKWQKQGRVRGIALTKERFQFLFTNEQDLIDTMETGVHSFNEWTVVTERWVENPPQDYLRYIYVWVQIRNLPVNHYTYQMIWDLGDLIGESEEVAFDPEKSISQGYVRVKVKVDVSRPLRKSKVVNLPSGEKVEVFFYYERIQKRCYSCQRVTHEQEKCPLFIQARQERNSERKSQDPKPATVLPKVLKEDDPLFGVLKESQVGINPLTGRPRIDPTVLQDMRQYLLVANGPERIGREERVRTTIAEVEKDPVANKKLLGLQQPPLLTNILNKGKGLVFGYETAESSHGKGATVKIPEIKSGYDEEAHFMDVSQKGEDFASRVGMPLFDRKGFTVKRTGLLGSGSSGTNLKKHKTRKRETKNKRRLRVSNVVEANLKMAVKEGLVNGVIPKRKAERGKGKEERMRKVSKYEVVPNRGPLDH